MTRSQTVLVTGAAGRLGRRVVEHLIDAPETTVVAGTRAPEKLAHLADRGVAVRRVDFNDRRSLTLAFAGIDKVLLVSTDAMLPGLRFEQHAWAIAAAVDAGVDHVVYTSLSKAEPGSPVIIADDHIRSEQLLERSGLGYTSLRNNLYIELLLESLPRAIVTGQLVAAAGAGGAAYVTREDCARAAVAAIRSSFRGTRTLEITGPSVVTHSELAQLASELSGTAVTYVALHPAALRFAMVQEGLPEAMAALLASLDAGISSGYFAPATHAFTDLTGMVPTSVRGFLAAHLSPPKSTRKNAR